jgi:hypothetical protein
MSQHLTAPELYVHLSASALVALQPRPARHYDLRGRELVVAKEDRVAGWDLLGRMLGRRTAPR